jgi:hypothetical protein
VRTPRTSKCWVANSFNICLNFKASNWAQFSSDLQNSNCFEKLQFSSINFTKKNFFFACAHAAYARCIYIYLLATQLKDEIKSISSYSFLSDSIGFNPKETEPIRNFNGLISWQTVRFDLKPESGFEPIGSVWNRIIPRRICKTRSNLNHDSNHFFIETILNISISETSSLERFNWNRLNEKKFKDILNYLLFNQSM